MYSFTTSFFHLFISRSLKTHIFIHCSVLSFISANIYPLITSPILSSMSQPQTTHSYFHLSANHSFIYSSILPSSHPLVSHLPLTTSSSILLSSHPSANHSLTILSSILPSFIHQSTTDPLHPSSHLSANH